MCAITAYELMLRLQSAGYGARFVKSEFHCWVMVGSLTLDVAATQFVEDDSVDGVLIVGREGEDECSAYAQCETASTAKGVLSFNCWNQWVAHERPLPLQALPETCF